MVYSSHPLDDFRRHLTTSERLSRASSVSHMVDSTNRPLLCAWTHRFPWFCSLELPAIDGYGITRIWTRSLPWIGSNSFLLHHSGIFQSISHHWKEDQEEAEGKVKNIGAVLAHWWCSALQALPQLCTEISLHLHWVLMHVWKGRMYGRSVQLVAVCNNTSRCH